MYATHKNGSCFPFKPRFLCPFVVCTISLSNANVGQPAQSLVVIGAGLSVTKFLRCPLVTLASKRVLRLSASLFWASLVVIGAGLSVTRFFKAPLVTLASKREERLSASLFWANLVVIGAGLSVTKFLRCPLVTLAPM